MTDWDKTIEHVMNRLHPKQETDSGIQLGHTEYRIEPFENGFRVVSIVWNRGMFGHPHWFRNFVAECDTLEEADSIIERVTGGS